MSNILADTSTSGPTISDRTTYAQYAVSAWARCLAVAVDNGVTVRLPTRTSLDLGTPADLAAWGHFTQDWKPYLQYGTQSWKRLSDPVRRRDIGLFLVTEMIKHDPATQIVRAATLACLGDPCRSFC